MTERIRVYVAGPLTQGAVFHNVGNAMRAASTLLRLGYAPFVPHLSAFWDAACPHDYQEWIAYDLCWVAVCHAVVRLPGESPGADAEVAEAKRLGIPVFDSVEGLFYYFLHKEKP